MMSNKRESPSLEESRPAQIGNSTFFNRFKLTPTIQGFVLFIVFLVVGFLIALRSLGNFWYWDDLHLIRTFSPSELASVWIGNWDVDKEETPGYRPLTTLFNFTRAALFGENVVAHRIFLVFLYALTLMLFALALKKLGMPFLAAIIAGVLDLCAKYDAFHFTWISDGIHLAQGFVYSLAIYFLVLFFKNGPSFKLRYLALSFFFASIGILFREEGLSIFPILVILGIYLVFSLNFDNSTKRRLVKYEVFYTVGLFAVAVIYLIVRAIIVAGVDSSIHFLQPARLLINSTLFGGRDYFAWFSLLLGAIGGLLILLFPLLYCRFQKIRLVELLNLTSQDKNIKFWHLSILMIVFAMSSSLHGFVEARINVYFFSILFYCFFLCAVGNLYLNFFRTLTKRQFWVRIFEVAISIAVIFTLFISIRSSLLLQDSFNFYSVDALKENANYIFGLNLTIPPERRSTAIERFQKVGIDKTAYDEKTYIKLACTALRNNRFYPDDSETPFIPVEPTWKDEKWDPYSADLDFLAETCNR